MILLIVAFFIGGFFLGASVGKQKASEEFEKYLTLDTEEMDTNESRSQYSHTEFAIYYYNVYVPFHEFRKNYLDFYNRMHRPEGKSDSAALIKHIQAQSKKTKKELENALTPTASPLLQKSYTEYMSALSSIEAGIKSLAQSQTDDPDQISQFFKTNEQLKKGQNHWLRGQIYFYEGISRWESIYITRESPKVFEQTSSFSLTQWSALRFHQKNELVAKILGEKQILSFFNPEDVTMYLDSLTATGETSIQKVSEAIEVLIASGSVRQGEYLQQNHRYQDQPSPMIPLFPN